LILRKLKEERKSFFDKFKIKFFNQQKPSIGEIERDMPFTLTQVAIDLELGLSFENALKNAANSKNAFGVLLNRILFEVYKKGSSINEACKKILKKYKSNQLKRAFSQLLAIYEQGCKDISGLRRIIKEILAEQHSKAKEFNGKLVVYSIILIACSAIVPALFFAFTIVGGKILDLGLSADDIMLISTIGFPLLNILIFLFIRSNMPVFLR